MNATTLEKLESLFTKSITRHYKKGHIFILPGQTSDLFYNVIAGRMKVYDVTYRGDEIIIDRFGAQTFFPMSLIINSIPAQYIYEAEGDVTIKAVIKDAALSLLKENPAVVLDLFSDVYKVVDKTISRFINLATKNAKSRIIFCILDECQKFATIQENGDNVIYVSERDLAAIAGLSRETVSRQIKMLKYDNLISTHRNALTVHSLNKLEEYLHSHA